MITNVIYALVGGLLPALIWLLFWLREDRDNPEPTKRIIISFLAGGISIFFVLPIEKFAYEFFIATPILILLIWSFAEEIAKLGAAYIGGLRTKFFDEPVDAMIYLITAALGFAAFENAFFLFSSLVDGPFGMAFITGNVRFVGASLLHVVASASIGAAIAFSWRKSRIIKVISLIFGVMVATLLHTVFNFLILNAKEAGTIIAFIFVWLSVIALIIVFESVKKISRKKRTI